MADWKEQLKIALDGVTSGGKFAVTGTVDSPLPEIAVRGVGKLALPIDAGQAEDLVFAGMPAPFGKGSKTVLDPAVRKAIQIEAARVRFSQDWDATVRRLTADVAAALLGVYGCGAVAGVEARLYKLLVYERGGHFRAHRDTEKEPGMFGSLLIQLPVAGGHTGGSLSVRLQQEEVVWDTAAAAMPGAATTFFADCEHELSEVESGLRVLLAYNLVQTQEGANTVAAAASASAATATAASKAARAAGRAPAAAAVKAKAAAAGRAAALRAVAEAVRAWEAAGEASQPLVALPLAHKYTEASLGFGALKGDDSAKVRALLDCPELEVHLLLVDKMVIGGCDEYLHPDDYEEALETASMITDDDDYYTSTKINYIWHSSQFGRLGEDVGDFGLGIWRIQNSVLGDEELFPDDQQPYQKQYEPYTGNEGPSLTYWYCSALAVVWPRSRRPTVPDRSVRQRRR
eukprot:XP_001700646.1 predicted protein [Chlamydomonas reinhardtii]